MNALETILKSRKDSVAKVEKQIADLDTAIRDCSLSVKPVYETERKVKASRLAALRKDIVALEAELSRLNPELPGMNGRPPPQAVTLRRSGGLLALARGPPFVPTCQAVARQH